MLKITHTQKIAISVVSLSIILSLVLPTFVLAQAQIQQPINNTPGAGKGTNNAPSTVRVNLTPKNTQAQPAPVGGNSVTGGGYKGLVRCDGVRDPNNPQSRVCDYSALVDTANYLINWLLYIAVTLSVLLFMYAGGLYITGVPKHIEKAHSIFKSVVKGLLFMLLAWFIISTLLDWLEVDPTFKSLIE